MARIEFQVDQQQAEFDVGHFRRLWRFAAPHRAKMAVALAFITAGTVAQLAVPWLTQMAIDDYIAPGDFSGLLTVVAVLVAAVAVYAFSHYRRVLLMSWIGQRVLYDIRQQVFTHMQRLSFKFFQREPTGKIISRLTSDVRHLQEFLVNGLILLVADSLVIVGIIVAMFWMHPQLAMLSLATLPIVVIVIASLRVRIRRAHLRERETMANIYANMQEAIAGVRLVQSYARQKVNEEHFDRVNGRQLAAALRTARLGGMLNPAVEVTSALAVSLLLWFSAMTIYGDMPGEAVSVGIITAFIAYLQMFYDPVRDLSNVYNVMQSAMASADRIFEVLDTAPEITDAPGAYALPPVRGDVAFDDVTFGYDPKRPVLFDIDLQVRAGETIALVGPTGAGKTSIANLVARFYDPTEGRVTVDEHDLRHVTVRSLRDQVAIVVQEPFLFSGTIADNIRYGRPDASHAEVVRAARAAFVHDFISALPDGYDTEVGERGGALSEGQRQLLAFARALLIDPAILILDEATSNVDASTEVLIQRALDRLLEGRTTFVVAHRLSTIRNADRIVVIDDGRILQVGPHEQLVAEPGLYRTLHDVYLQHA